MYKLKSFYNHLAYIAYLIFVGVMFSNPDNQVFFVLTGALFLILAPAWVNYKTKVKAEMTSTETRCRKCGSWQTP